MPLRQASAALQDEREVPANGTGTTDLSLRLLDFLARSAEPVGLSELARQFQASKATIHRHLQTLAYHDFVRQDPATMRYAAGIHQGRGPGAEDMACHYPLVELRRLARDMPLAVRLHLPA